MIMIPRWLFVCGLTMCSLALLADAAAAAAAGEAPKPLAVESPDGGLRATFRLEDKGRPAFDVTYRGTAVAGGTLGLEFARSRPLGAGLRVVNVRRASRDETYAIAVGKASSARDHHNELVVSLEEASPPGRRLDLAFRAFDDGVAFRYLIPEQKPIGEFVLIDEQTRLTFPGASTARAVPLNSYTTSYEKYYQTLPAAEIGPKMLLGLPLLLSLRAPGAR